MDLSVETILVFTILAGILSIVYGYFTGKHILSLSPGNSKMQEIASAIQVGAKAYLNRQYKTIAIVGVVVLVIISYAFSILVGLGYLVGATLSGIAGYVGMLVSVQANVRTAEASRKGFASGLKESIAGLITGRNLSSITLPLYSVTEVAFVYIFNASDPTRITQSYSSVLISISTSAFKTFFLLLSEHKANLSNAKAPSNLSW